MKKAYIMYCCDDNGEYQLWFDETKNLISGYFCNDANWRSEYFDKIFKQLGVEIETLKYDKKIAKKSSKSLWGF